MRSPSAGAVFFNPAAQSVVPAIVAERDLVAANRGPWTAAAVSQIALAPWPVSWSPRSGCSWASGQCGPAIWPPRPFCIDWPARRRPGTGSGSVVLVRDVREGIRLLAGHRLLRELVASCHEP